MVKHNKGFKALVIILFFALCMPTMAYGNYEDSNMSEIFETAGAEAIIESPEEPAASQPGPAEIESSEPTAEETKESSGELIKESTADPVVTGSAEEEQASEAPAEIIGEEPAVTEDPEKVHEELREKKPQQIQAPEQVILTSVEGIPSEAVVEFTLDGRKIGLFSNGTIYDAVPILTADQQRVRASIANKMRIAGAKIVFDVYVEAKEPVIQVPRENKSIENKPAEAEEIIKNEEVIENTEPTESAEPIENDSPIEIKPVEDEEPAENENVAENAPAESGEPIENIEATESKEPVEPEESAESEQPESKMAIENKESVENNGPTDDA